MISGQLQSSAPDAKKATSAARRLYRIIMAGRVCVAIPLFVRFHSVLSMQKADAEREILPQIDLHGAVCRETIFECSVSMVLFRCRSKMCALRTSHDPMLLCWTTSTWRFQREKRWRWLGHLDAVCTSHDDMLLLQS